MAESMPFNKYTMVMRLKQLMNVVTVTDQGCDYPAIKLCWN